MRLGLQAVAFLSFVSYSVLPAYALHCSGDKYETDYRSDGKFSKMQADYSYGPAVTSSRMDGAMKIDYQRIVTQDFIVYRAASTSGPEFILREDTVINRHDLTFSSASFFVAMGVQKHSIAWGTCSTPW